MKELIWTVDRGIIFWRAERASTITAPMRVATRRDAISGFPREGYPGCSMPGDATVIKAAPFELRSYMRQHGNHPPMSGRHMDQGSCICVFGT